MNDSKQEQKIYVFGFFQMFLILIPVAIPFFQTFGLSMHQIFQLQALTGLGIVLFEVPTGYLADLVGRKKTMLLGACLTSVGFSGFLLAQNFWHLCVVELILALGISLVSGSDTAMLYESLDKRDRKKTSRAFANLQLAEQSGESIAALLGGALAVYSLRTVAWAQFISSLIVILVVLSFHENKRVVSTNHKSNFKKVYQQLFQGDPLLKLTFINATFWGLSTFFAVWTYQKHWQEVGLGLAYFGVVWAAFNITTGLVGRYVHSWEHKFGARSLLLTMALLAGLGYWGLASMAGLWSVLFGFCHYVSRGINGVMMTDAINWRVDSEFRATINSLRSFAFRLGFMLFGPLVGWSIDRWSLQSTYLILGAVFLAGVPLVLMPLIKQIESLGKHEIPH